mgnify:CR=1 FL=1
MRRGVNVARQYAEHRAAFGARVVEHPLQRRVLAEMEVRVRASVAFLFDVVAMVGRGECGGEGKVQGTTSGDRGVKGKKGKRKRKRKVYYVWE